MSKLHFEVKLENISGSLEGFLNYNILQQKKKSNL